MSEAMLNVAVISHRRDPPSDKYLSAIANRTFDVNSFGAWTQPMNWCVKKAYSKGEAIAWIRE